MDEFNLNYEYNLAYDSISFNDLNDCYSFEGLLDTAFPTTSPPLIQEPDSFSDVGPLPSIIQEHELRPYLEGLDVMWSPFTSSSSSQSPPSSSPLFPEPSPTFSSPTPYQFPLHPQFLPAQSVDLISHSQESTLFSPETVTSSFNFGSPSSSTSGTFTASPLCNKRARTLSVKEESEVEESSKRARTSSSSDGPVELVFLTAPQPAYSSTVASTSRLPIATPTQARCHCVFKRGNQKPARHWRTACPYNPDRHNPTTKFRCEVTGCSMEFGRRDNRDRHVRKFH